MSIFNAEKRQKLMTKFLQKLNVKVDDRSITVHQEDFVFLFNMFQTNIKVSLIECSQCPLDCNKFIEFYLEPSQLENEEIDELEKEDFLLLAHVKKILDYELPIESEILKNKLREKIHILNFGLIGYDQVGKTTLFEIVPGNPKKVPNLINTYSKKITTFPPFLVKIYDYGTRIMENLVSNTPAPLLYDKLRYFYLYILVTDSSPQNVTNTKKNILPKLKRLSPYAAIIVIANKQDLPNRLSGPLIEKILSKRTYSMSALNPDSKEIFTQLVDEIILLRQEQLHEYKCPFFE